MAILRPVVPDDSRELARLLRKNRDFMAPFEPLRDERFFTSEGQREIVALGHGAILLLIGLSC